MWCRMLSIASQCCVHCTLMLSIASQYCQWSKLHVYMYARMDIERNIMRLDSCLWPRFAIVMWIYHILYDLTVGRYTHLTRMSWGHIFDSMIKHGWHTIGYVMISCMLPVFGMGSGIYNHIYSMFGPYPLYLLFFGE
jgi:hypothetical protein